MICGQLESDHRLSKYSLRDEKVKKTILKATGISKSFSHVPILKNVRFELDSAETHILMGENGAGKSTLMKIITGVYQQDKGNIYLDDGKGNLKKLLFQILNGIGKRNKHGIPGIQPDGKYDDSRKYIYGL